MKKRLYALIALFCLLFTLVLTARADFGSYSGDSDYGGYDDYSYSYYDDGYSNSYYDDDDDDYSYSYHYSSNDNGGGSYSALSGGSGSSEDSVFYTIVGGVVFFGIITLLLRKPLLLIIGLFSGKGRKTSRPHAPVVRTTGHQGADTVFLRDLRPIEEYTDIDPAFDVAEIQEKLSNLYVKMQNAWTDRDIEPLRPYFTDAFFTQMERQLSQMRKQGVTNYVDRIAVLDVAVKGFRQQDGTDHVIAVIKTRIVDYTLNDKTGELVAGDRKKEKFMTYGWDLCRSADRQTAEHDGTEKIVCPSCGAPLDVNASARCPYCGSVINRDEHDWAICAIRGIAQRSGK